MKKHYLVLSILVFQFLLVNRSKAQTPIPHLDWATYFSGQLTSVDYIEVDTAHQQVVIAGVTADTTGIATSGAYKEHMVLLPSVFGGPPMFLFGWKSDVFIAKFDLSGNLLWGTYFGGDDFDRLNKLAIDGLGNIYITGYTKSATDITTTSAHQPYVYFPPEDETSLNTSYLAKFSPEGNLLWSTYYGNAIAHIDSGTCIKHIVIDQENNVYISGFTKSNTGIATPGSWQSIKNGVNDGFIAKFDSSGNRVWGTYYGGHNANIEDNHLDDITAMCIDNDNNLIITGVAYDDEGVSMGTLGTYKPNPDVCNGFIAKFNSSGSRIWHSYLDNITLMGIVSDNDGNLYLEASTTSSATDIATEGAYQETYGGGSYDITLMKFSTTGNKIWGTYYGGEDSEPWGLMLADPVENYFTHSQLRYSPMNGGSLYIAGITNSNTGIENACGYQPTTDYHRGFLAKFDLSGQLHYSGYYDEGIYSMAINSSVNSKEQEIYICTRPDIEGLATEGSFKDNKTGLIRSGLVAKFIETCPEDSVSITYTYPSLLADSDFAQYKWYHNGSMVFSGTENSYTTTDTSGYYYCIAIRCGCEYRSDTITFSSTGIDGAVNHRSLYIYPNPATQELNIDIKDLAVSDATILIIDIMGRELLTQKVSPGSRKSTIDIATLPKGVYTIQLKNNEGVWIEKFVKE